MKVTLPVKLPLASKPTAEVMGIVSADAAPANTQATNVADAIAIELFILVSPFSFFFHSAVH
ncbi:MAG: hypothetical protein ACREJO_18285 [Phycisphaerales bacterium]